MKNLHKKQNDGFILVTGLAKKTLDKNMMSSVKGGLTTEVLVVEKEGTDKP